METQDIQVIYAIQDEIDAMTEEEKAGKMIMVKHVQLLAEFVPPKATTFSMVGKMPSEE